jgi:hypothetical protein
LTLICEYVTVWLQPSSNNGMLEHVVLGCEAVRDSLAIAGFVMCGALPRATGDAAWALPLHVFSK